MFASFIYKMVHKQYNPPCQIFVLCSRHCVCVCVCVCVCAPTCRLQQRLTQPKEDGNGRNITSGSEAEGAEGAAGATSLLACESEEAQAGQEASKEAVEWERAHKHHVENLRSTRAGLCIGHQCMHATQ